MTARVRLTLASALATGCAASALGTVFRSASFLPAVFVGVALVALAGMLVRRAGLPAVAGPLLAAVFLLGWLTVLFARSEAYGGVLPGGRALAQLSAVTRQGFADIRTLVTPVPLTSGLTLLAVVGVALVAVVADLLAVTLRRATLAGLPLLALYGLAAAVAPHGAGTLSFAIGAAGYLVLLGVDGRERLTGWGRALDTGRQAFIEGEATAPGSPMAALGRRIGVASLAVAALVPLAVPTLHAWRFGRGGGGGTGGGQGSGPLVTYNPLVRIRDQLVLGRPVPLLVVRTSNGSGLYLRMTALDTYTDDSWTQSGPLSPDQQVGGGSVLPSPDGLTAAVPTAPLQVTVKVQGGLSVHWLPLPFPASSLQVGGDWSYDDTLQTVFSSGSTSMGMSYQVTALDLQPSTDELADAPPPPAALAADLQLPADLPPQIRQLAKQITAGAGSAFERALRIQQFFLRPPFVYDESVTNSDDPATLLTFLTVTHRGFCEQYAAAMAVLARAVGIPARVAIGFTPGVRQRDGSWLVTTRDAHAWPELYFSGVGWLRFEPTPRADGQAQPPPYALPTGGPGQPTSAAPPPSPRGVNPKLGTLLSQHPDGSAPVPTPTVSGRSGSVPVLVLVVVGLLLLLLCAPALLRFGVRRRRRRATTGPAAAHAAWAELHDLAVDLGLPWRSSDSPRGATARVFAAGAVHGDPRLREHTRTALSALARAEERARYAPRVGTTELADVWRALDAARRGLLAAARRPGRWRALLLPRSVLGRAHLLTDRPADLLAAADALLTRAAALLSPRRRTAG